MSTKSTPTRYGSVAIAIHWASALAVIVTFAAGFVLDKSHPTPLPLLAAHVVLGTCVLVLTLLRIVWWMVADRRPDPADQPRWQQMSASAVHGLLYLVLLVMTLSGIATMVLSGGFPALFAGGPIPDFSGILPRLVHGAMSKVLLALFAVHVGAALYHQFVRHDGIMARMGVRAGS